MRRVLLCVMLAFVGSAQAGKVVIDTGHRKVTPGSTAADGTPEYELNRTMALAVVASLQRAGHTVVDVASTGNDRTLYARTRETADAGLFLSLHHDSIQQQFLDQGRAGEFSGFSVFVSAKSKQVDGSLRCALAIGDAMVAAGEQPSLYHAEPILGENRPLLDRARGIHRFDNLAVLKDAQSPAVLLELGVGVNPYDLPRLKDPRWVDEVADQLARAIGTCIR